MKILFAITEAYPFAKVGGLGDVGAGLPAALAHRGHDVTLVLPGYRRVETGAPIHELRVPLGTATETVVIQDLGRRRDVRVLTAGNEHHFDRDAIYGYDDDDARFILFSKAVAGLAAREDPEPDVLHANDWHLGLLPQYARQGPDSAALQRSATVFTIHNLAYQGPHHDETEELVGLPGTFDRSLMARGIAFADAINTVSERYLEEILTPEHGMGLHELLAARRERLYGIRNGIDYSEFDPSIDPFIPAQYDPTSLERKRLNKVVLQERSGLALEPETPLIGMVARLVSQKGFDLLCESLDGIVKLGAQVVVAGVGDDGYRRCLAEAAERLPAAVSYFPIDEEWLARLVYAGSDLLLAPSTFEPCGLGPLIGLRYGAIPVVRRTGGLAETIHDVMRDPEQGLGFTFVPKYRRNLLAAIQSALDVYFHDRPTWEQLQRRAMVTDFSWGHSTISYERMYSEALTNRRTEAEPASGRTT